MSWQAGLDVGGWRSGGRETMPWGIPFEWGSRWRWDSPRAPSPVLSLRSLPLPPCPDLCTPPQAHYIKTEEAELQSLATILDRSLLARGVLRGARLVLELGRGTTLETLKKRSGPDWSPGLGLAWTS